MQQRQLRLGDILDDYCPRERRLTNHAVVAMVGADVKQTRCTTCDAEHEYKHAKVPRQRRKSDAPAALYSQVLAAGGPKHVTHETPEAADSAASEDGADAAAAADALSTSDPDPGEATVQPEPAAESGHDPGASLDGEDDFERDEGVDEGPVHRPLIRATFPRPEGQPPSARPAPDFTIRQPGGRTNRFRSRQQRGPFQGNRSNGNFGGPMRGDQSRGGGRPHQGGSAARPGRHHGHKRSK